MFSLWCSVVNPWIMEQKKAFNVLGTFFLCPAIFFQVSFLGFINGKNCWYSNCSSIRQLYEMKGIKFITREMH